VPDDRFAWMTAFLMAWISAPEAPRSRLRRTAEQLIDVIAARCVSPLVDSTSKTPSSTRKIEMSKVPPPKS
jgi:hypothetical protein